MTWLLALQILLPFVAAVASWLLRAGRGGQILPVLATLGSLGLAMALVAAVATEGVVAGQMSAWPAPFGITLVADYLSAAMVLITAIIGAAVTIWSLAEIGAEPRRAGFYPLLMMLLGGVTGAFLTGDIFNLYVWFEVLVIASFGLMVISNRAGAIDGAVKYVFLNLVATALFLLAAGLLYGVTGTLNMADLHQVIRGLDDSQTGLITLVALLFMLSFGIKAGAFPLFFWLPASYHTPYFAVSAVFAGLLTKVGVYALIRSFTLVFDLDTGGLREILLVVACLTMVTGVLGAAAQNHIRRILSFHIISQIGYMLLGLALPGALALAGGVFYLIHHIIVKANLFLIAGIVARLGGSEELRRLGGLAARAPLLALLFLIPALSLAGLPPLSGFWAKYIILRAALAEGEAIVAVLILVVGGLTLFSMSKIWEGAFHRPAETPPGGLGDLTPGMRVALLGPVVALAMLTLVIGIFTQPFVEWANIAAAQLGDPSAYVAAVLGEGQP